jgi:hypothetical protein
MWQGPSLGCPPNGGLEFAPDQTLSYYGGQIAARLKARYEVAGDRVTVTSTGVSMASAANTSMSGAVLTRSSLQRSLPTCRVR